MAGVALSGLGVRTPGGPWAALAPGFLLGTVVLARRVRPATKLAALLAAYLLAGLLAWPAWPRPPAAGTLVRLEALVLDGRRGPASSRLLLLGEGGTRYSLALPSRFADGRTAPLPPPGSRVRVSARAARAPRRGPTLLRAKSAALVTVLHDGGEGPRRWRERARAYLRKLLAPPGSGDPGALLRALILGEREALPRAAERDLRSAGLSHILAVSGLHVGLVGGALLLVGLRLGLRARGALLLSTSGAALYGVLVGARPPVLRAVGMLSVAAAARLSGRRAGGLAALAWAAGGVALVLPEEVPLPGFQLSFTACAALLLSGRGASGSRSVRLARACLAAQLGTLPLVLLHFGRIAPFALPANLLGLPLVTAAVGASFLAALLHALWPGAGWAVAALARETAGLLLLSAELVAELPGSGRLVGAVGAPWCAASTLAVLLAIGIRGPGRLLPGGLFLLFLAAGPLRGEGTGPPAGALEIVALDVGQGSAILVRAGGGARLLVDGGGSPGSDYPVGERRLLPQLRSLGVGRLDLVVLTHPDADHGEGLEAALEALPVGRLVLPGEDCGHPLARRLAASAARRGIPTEGWWAGYGESLGGLRLEVLAPARDSVCGGNDESLVLRVDSEGGALLLPGDIERAGESSLLARGAGLGARVLVLPHHGSAGSSSEAFLEAVRPELVLVQAGRANPYGHPDPGLLEELRRRRVRVYRSDRDGVVRARLLADGRLLTERLTR